VLFTVHTRLCTWAVNTPVYRVHSRTRMCTGHGRTMYMARARSYTQSVHGPGHVPCIWAALYTGRKHGRVQGTRPCTHTVVYSHGRVPCTRPCLRPVYRAVHGHVQTVYTAVHGPCTWSIHDPNTAVFTAVYAVIHGVYGPCTTRHNAYQALQ